MSNLTEAVSTSLGIKEGDANEVINEQVEYCQDLLKDNDLRFEDIEQAMYDMGIEPDYMDEFLLRFC